MVIVNFKDILNDDIVGNVEIRFYYWNCLNDDVKKMKLLKY